MSAFKTAMDHTAMSQRRDLMTHLQTCGTFRRWITIPFLWEPDASILQNFGSLPSLDNRIGGFSARRPVRRSPLLAIFIKNHTEYKQSITGPDPDAALRHFLRACFVMEEKMFVGSYSPYNLLSRGSMVIDLAFMRAVVPASKWLGVASFPKGHISIWPPKEQGWL